MSEYVPTPAELEKRRRIRLATAAFSYERMFISLITDHEYDRACLEINLDQETGNPELDAWWREHFDPSTGMWVNLYPDLNGLERVATMRARHLGLIPD